MEDVRLRRGTTFNLQAAGGSGNTFLLQVLLWAMRRDRSVAIATAATALASQNLENGTTVHAAAGVPVPTMPTSSSRIRGQSNSTEARVWRECRLLLIDEAPSLDMNVLDCVDRMLRDIRRVDVANGGLTVVLSGDTRQTLPIVVRGNRPAIMARTLGNLPYWDQVEHRQLNTNERINRRVLAGLDVQAARRHADYLLRIGNGTEPHAAVPEFMYTDMISVPEEYLLQSQHIDDAIHYVYEELPNIASMPDAGLDYLAQRAILTCKNVDAVSINNQAPHPDPDSFYDL
jgi:hypothetical protein